MGAMSSGRDDDVLGRDPQLRGSQDAHGLRFLLAVGVAGVGVAAVDDDRLRPPVGEMPARDRDGRALHEVLGIDCGRGAWRVSLDEREVALLLILADAAVDARRRKTAGGGHAAGKESEIALLQRGSDPFCLLA